MKWNLCLMPMNVTKFHSRQNYCLHCAIWRKDTSPYISICWHYKCVQGALAQGTRAPALSAGRTHVFISIVRYFMGFARPCTSARKLVCNWRQESLHCWRDKARLPFVLFNRKMVKEIAYLQRTHSNRVGVMLSICIIALSYQHRNLSLGFYVLIQAGAKLA